MRESPGALAEGVFDLQTGVAPLHVAAKTGQLHALHLLLELGAGVEWQDGAGLTALQVRGCALPPPSVCGRAMESVGPASLLARLHLGRHAREFSLPRLCGRGVAWAQGWLRCRPALLLEHLPAPPPCLPAMLAPADQPQV